MKVYYSDVFPVPLPEKHRFPIAKYALLRQHLQADGIIQVGDFHIPEAASDDQLALAHDADYIQRVRQGQLSSREQRAIGFPWSPQLVERARRSVGGTIHASLAALEDGGGLNLAGGTHHAGRAHGQGFCLFNDAAVAIRSLQANDRIERAVILDCDVHQGNGSAEIFARDPRVVTFSIHGEKNYPFRKTPGDLDIGLPDDTQDEAYVAALEKGLRRALSMSRPDLAIYVAGADPYSEDRLGRLGVSKEGLAARDHMVYSACLRLGLPVATVMGGGYARDIHDTVAIHMRTVTIAVQYVTRITTQGDIAAGSRGP